jgi:hypothetical protein
MKRVRWRLAMPSAATSDGRSDPQRGTGEDAYATFGSVSYRPRDHSAKEINSHFSLEKRLTPFSSPGSAALTASPFGHRVQDCHSKTLSR